MYSPVQQQADIVDWTRELANFKYKIVADFRKELKSSEERLLKKIDLSAGLLEVKQTTKLLNVRLNAVETACEEIATIKSELTAMRAEVEKRESEIVSTDLVISGIPYNIEGTCSGIFAEICKVVKQEAPAVREIFRLPPRK